MLFGVSLKTQPDLKRLVESSRFTKDDSDEDGAVKNPVAKKPRKKWPLLPSLLLSGGLLLRLKHLRAQLRTSVMNRPKLLWGVLQVVRGKQGLWRKGDVYFQKTVRRQGQIRILWSKLLGSVERGRSIALGHFSWKI